MTSIINQNRSAIKAALRDYVAHTYTQQGMFAQGMPSDDFISRLAVDSAHAKSGLRDMFRKADGWNEELQAVVVNGTQTHDPNPNRIEELIQKIIPQSVYQTHNYGKIIVAYSYFVNGKGDEECVDALKYYIGRAYRPDKKPSKLFQAFAKAIGVYDSTAGSNYQRLFAQLADEMNGRKLDFKLFLSINPAHILTASNPANDKRGQCLVSCHSLNRDDYSYGAGNIGYARDSITFIIFTAADPNDTESLTNRKTSRQFGFYKPASGVLLQSRLYNTKGGTYNEQPISNLYRDLVQRTISNAEGAINLWQTYTYRPDGQNKFDIYFGADPDFSGYRDWTNFRDGEIKLSVRKDCLESAYGTSYIIGAPSLCVSCGDEICEGDEPHWFCGGCDTECETCEECGCRADTDCGTWAIGADGREIFVCDNCLTNNYFYCEDCGQYHHVDNGVTVANGDTVCEDCLNRFYFQCDDCGEWFKNDYANYINGRTLCTDCFNENYSRCDECGEWESNDDLYWVEVDGVTKALCYYCAERHEQKGHTA